MASNVSATLDAVRTVKVSLTPGAKPLISSTFNVPPKVAVPTTFSWSCWEIGVSPPISISSTPELCCV